MLDFQTKTNALGEATAFVATQHDAAELNSAYQELVDFISAGRQTPTPLVSAGSDTTDMMTKAAIVFSGFMMEDNSVAADTVILDPFGPSSTIPTLAQFVEYSFKFINRITNTGATTMTAFGATLPMKRPDLSALSAGDLVSGQIYTVLASFSGGGFILMDYDRPLNSAHRLGDGSDHSDVGLNNTHRGSDGTDHSNVVLNDTHRASAGTDHSDVGLNNTHRASAGTDHSDVGLNNTHRASAGTDHSDVGLNNTHRGLVTGNPHNVLATQVSDFNTQVRTLTNLFGIIKLTDSGLPTWGSDIDPRESRKSGGFTVTGASVGDTVVVRCSSRVDATPGGINQIAFEAEVTGADTVKIWAINANDADTITLAQLNAATYDVTVFKLS